MQAGKRNMERMVEAVPESDWQSLQNFISHSPWDAFALMKRIALDADHLISGDKDSCLIIDESGFSKKGKQSVGVSRQWNGRLGKVDNCQVGVFAALNCREKVTLIDTRLYLPKSWTEDKARCQGTDIPHDRLIHRKKAELALEMIASARAQGLSYQWIGADGFYGEDPEFVRQLDQWEETFMLDVHCDQVIYLEDPAPYVPAAQSSRGRKPSRLKSDVQRTTVFAWAAMQPAKKWQKVTVRDTTKGKLTVEVLHGRVWLWDGSEVQGHQWHLIVRREKGSKNKLKYSISNAAAHTPTARLAFMQAQRYFVERAFEDAKTSAGLADYQVRTWTGWHHHVALVMLAMLFMLQTKLKYAHVYELLSTNDIRILLTYFLPKRAATIGDIVQQMEIRHQKRKRAIKAYLKYDIGKSD